MITPGVSALIDLALEEDLGHGDATSAALFDAKHDASVAGVLLAKQKLVLFGLEVAAEVFRRVSPQIVLTPRVAEGTEVEPKTVVADVNGPASALLMAERTALNFLQRLSGVATMSRKFAAAVEGTKARVVDTRKTTPGWRSLEKAAVRAGGCHNHRADLGSGLLIKDNHIAAAGGVGLAVKRARERGCHSHRVEVEVTNLAELEQALDAGCEVVLLDNMPLPALEDAVKRAHERGVLVEVSGGVRLETVGAIARTGPDLISAGALTHSAPAVDISLDFAGSS
jgi:nicotinate-nucleotide pyrophosphorylase (carboxylating)